MSRLIECRLFDKQTMSRTVQPIRKAAIRWARGHMAHWQ